MSSPPQPTPDTEQRQKEGDYIYGDLPTTEQARQELISSIQSEIKRVADETEARKAGYQTEVKRLQDEYSRQYNREYGYYESELTRMNRLHDISSELFKYRTLASTGNPDPNQNYYVSVIGKRMQVLQTQPSTDELMRDRAAYRATNVEAPRVPGDAGAATRKAQGIPDPKVSYYDINKERPEGNVVSNILHSDKYMIGGYRSPTTGKYYESQDEAYRHGAAPAPPKQYFVGLTENITTRSGNDPKRYFVGLTENITTSKAPRAFAVSLSEGAPQKPKELSQEQVNQLTPQQYAVYRAEIDAYNKAVEQYNAQQKQLFKAAKEQNVLQWKQSKSELLFDIAELKRKGVTVLSAQTTEGPKDIPINNAFKALSSGKIGGATITGLGIAPTIPEGFTVTGLSNQTLVPGKELIEKAQREEEAKQRNELLERDPTGLSKFIYKEEQMAIGVGKSGPLDPNSLARSGSYYYAALGTNIAGLMNIAKSGTGFILEKLGGTKLGVASALGTPTLYQQKIQDPYTLGFNAPLTAAQESIMEGNATKFPVVLQQEAVKAAEVARKAPIGAIVGQGAGFFVTTGAPVPTSALRAIPLRYTKLPLYTVEGLVESQRTVSVGYDRTLKPLIGKYGPAGEGKFFTGKADPVKAGAEKIAAPVGGSSFDRFQPSNLDQAQRTLLKPLIQYGEEKGLTPKGFTGGVEPRLIKSQKEERTTPYRYEKQVPPKILSGLESGQPTYTVLGEIGKTTEKKLIEPAKGSIIQRLLEGGLSREIGDIDVEAPTLKKAAKASERLGRMQVGKDYIVEKQGFNISIKNPKKGTEAEINIISPKEEIKNVLGVSTERVYDLKYPTKKIKFSIPESKEKFYTKTMQYQTRAKTASITGIETRESLLAEGMSVEDVNRIMGSSKYVFAPKGRRLQKDIMDRYMGEREAARVEFQAGNRAKALEAAKTMVSIQKYYGPMIKDFGAAIREYKPSASFEEAVPKKPTSEKILSGSNTVAPKALRVSSPLVSTRQERESPYTRSAYSGSATLGSVKIESPRSALSARSSRSALSSGSIKSGGLSGSVKTITSSSAKTSSAEISAKSGLPKSGFSGKSGLSARPSPSGKSTFGPSPKSVFSPSPRSPSVSPLTSPGPSPLSPPSPKSPSLMPRPIPKLQPVPQLKPIGLRPPFLKNRTKKEKTSAKGTEEFFGSTNIASVLGFRSKKKDFDYGKDLSGLAAKNIKTTDPIRKSAMTKGKTRSMLTQPKRYFTPTKKQSNKFLRL